MSNIRLAMLAVFLSIVPAVGAWAQSLTANKVVIVLTGTDCDQASQVSLVIGGDDRAYRAERDPLRKCRWTAERESPPFALPETRFSLRLSGMRTRCRHAEEIRGELETLEPVAYLKFFYDPTKARANELTITMNPATLFVRYKRMLPEDKADKGSVQCAEGDRARGSARLVDVLLAEETLRLSLELKPGDDDWMVLDEELRQRIIRDAKMKKETTITLAHLGPARVRQIALDTKAICPNAGDVWVALLQEKGLANIQVKAK